MSDPIPCVIYAAKSTADTRGSIKTQLEDCRAMAEREGWEVVAEFQDEGFSAYSGNRGPGLEQAKARAAELAAEHGEAVLVAQHSDRLARGAGDAPGAAESLTEVWHALARQDVRLRSAQNDAMLSDPLLVAASSKLAHEESKRKSESVTGGMKRRRRRGQNHGGPRPYGYRYRDKTAKGKPTGPLVPVKAEAAIVRRIFAEYLAGTSQLAISRNLEADKVKTIRGGKWHQGTVRAILANPVYAGMIRDGDKLIKGVHKAILDDGVWEKAEALRTSKARTQGGGRPPAGQHLFRKGMLRCGECGEAMIPRTSPNRASPPAEVYRCYGRHRDKDSCSMPPLPRAEIDGSVYKYFEEVGLDVEATRAAVAESVGHKVAEVRALLQQAETEAQKAAERLSRVRRDYQDGKLEADDWADQRAQLEDELDGARAEVERLRGAQQSAEEGHGLVDVEGETLRRLAEIRKAITGEINDAAGTDAVRAALSRLFDGFVVHRHPPSVVREMRLLEHHGHPEAHAAVERLKQVPDEERAWIEPLISDPVQEGEGIVPRLREPLVQAGSNQYVTLTR